jgi:hypothetical protein
MEEAHSAEAKASFFSRLMHIFDVKSRSLLAHHKISVLNSSIDLFFFFLSFFLFFSNSTSTLYFYVTFDVRLLECGFEIWMSVRRPHATPHAHAGEVALDPGRITDVLRKLKDIKTYLHTLFPSLLIATPSSSAPSSPLTHTPVRPRAPTRDNAISKAGEWSDDLLRTRVEMLAQLRLVSSSIGVFISFFVWFDDDRFSCLFLRGILAQLSCL